MEQRTLWDILWAAGQDFGIAPFGMRAMMSLRLDRFFGSWMSEFSPDYTCAETGLDRFIQWSKGDFIGRAAAEVERATPPARVLTAFEVEAIDVDVHGYEPIWLQGKVVGFCTSGGYSHFARTSVAFGFVPRDALRDDLEVEIEILGEMRKARRITRDLVDPERLKMTT
jgi:dimethylglycine dehydrogenase